MSINVLLNKLFLLTRNGLVKGYVFFDNDKVIDYGEEPKPEYELSELVISYDYKGLILHGFSVSTSLTDYPFRGIGLRDLSVFSDNELKDFVYAGLYELYLNGITLPIIRDQRPDIVNEVVKSNNFKAVIVHEAGTVKHYQGVPYIEVEDDNLYFNGEKIGDKNIFCPVKSLMFSDCILDLSNNYTFNIASIINYLLQIGGGLHEVLELLTTPYKVLGMDQGFIDKGSQPDLIIYDLRDSVKTTPLNNLLYVLPRSCYPDQVFIDGDMFFDRGEPLLMLPKRIDQYFSVENGR